MNSINWPASSVWVFIAQLVRYCSANAEATGSNPVEAPKSFFRAFSQLFKLRLTAMVRTYSFLLGLAGRGKLEIMMFVINYLIARRRLNQQDIVQFRHQRSSCIWPYIDRTYYKVKIKVFIFSTYF